jgi:beta-phosphoglucomutase family hydrolase
MIKAVIFDMDGVIAETERAHIEAEKQTMLKHGVRISEDELHEYTGTTAKMMFTDLINKYNLDTTFEEIFREKEGVLDKMLEEDIQPAKGVIDLLLLLKKKKIKLAVASSSHRKMIEHVLKKLMIIDLFDSIIGAEDINRSKPNPEIFLLSAKRLDVAPEECWVVEDSKFGVEAAKKAGMKCLGYANPSSGKQDLSKADLIVHDFRRLDVNKLIG